MKTLSILLILPVALLLSACGSGPGGPVYAAGYSGPEEFIEHVLERELAKLEDTQSDEEIVKKLKGLGYLE